MESKLLAVLVVILVAASLGIGFLAGNTTSHTLTSTVTSPPTFSTSTEVHTITSTVTSTASEGQPIPLGSVETANITVEGVNAVAANSNRVYAVGSSYLVVVDASSHSILANVSLPGENQGGIVNAGLAIDSSTGTVYASLEGEVVEINGSTNSVARELPFNFGTLAFDSATHDLWGTQTLAQSPVSRSNGSLVAVDVQTGSVVANVSVGFAPDGIAVDPQNDMVYSAGCSSSFVCGSEAAVVNGTSGTLIKEVSLPSGYYSTMTLNPVTDVLYVSGERLLAALNGTDGDLIFQADPQTCGPFLGMAIDPSSNQVFVAPQNYDYLLVYDGTSGALVNMYSFPGSVGALAFNPNTNEVYVNTSSGLVALHGSASTGNVNGTAIGSYLNCLPP